MKPRFSKKELAHFIGRKMEFYERTLGFHGRTGYFQVTGKGEDASRNYGEYSQLKDLVSIFDLNWQDVYDGREYHKNSTKVPLPELGE